MALMCIIKLLCVFEIINIITYYAKRCQSLSRFVQKVNRKAKESAQRKQLLGTSGCRSDVGAHKLFSYTVSCIRFAGCYFLLVFYSDVTHVACAQFMR